MMYTLGIKKKHGTYHPDTIFDEEGNAICMVYGISSNVKLEDLGESDAAGLAMARKIVDALNATLDPYFCGECGKHISFSHHPLCSHNTRRGVIDT